MVSGLVGLSVCPLQCVEYLRTVVLKCGLIGEWLKGLGRTEREGAAHGFIVHVF